MNGYCNREMTNIYKGIAILLVILCHFMGTFGRGITIFTPLGGIGVAIFLLLSGYGLNESWSAKANRGHAWWRKRIMSVFIPYLIVQMLFYWPFHELGIKYFILDITLLKPLYHNDWYLSYLLLWYVIFYITRKIKILDRYRVVIFIILSVVLFFTQTEIRAEQSFSFLSGILLSEKKEKQNKVFLIRNGVMLILFGVCFLALKQFPIIRSAHPLIMNMIQLFIKLPIGMGVLILAYFIGKCINISWLKWIGLISYELYLVHGYILENVQVTILGAMEFIVGSVGISFVLWVLLDKTKQLQMKLLRM